MPGPFVFVPLFRGRMAELVADRRHLSRTSLVDWVGKTPLVRLRRFETRSGVEIYAKLEMKNPGGSVKDRAALAMMLEGERSGALDGGRSCSTPRPGNTGIAYAMLGAARGHRVRLCVPSNVTPERKRLLQRLWRRPRADRSDGRQRRRHPPGARHLRARARSGTSTRTSTATRRTGGRISRPPGRRSWNRRRAASRTSWRGWARAARSSAPGAVSSRTARTSRSSRSSRIAVARPRGAQAHGVSHRPGHLRSDPGRRGRCACRPTRRMS